MNKKKKSTNTSPYPDEVIDRLARAFYPAILACWNSEEGQREFAAWQAEQAHHANKKEIQEVPAGELPVVHIAVVCGFNRKFYKQRNSQQPVCDMQFTVVANESNRELRWQGASGRAHPVFVLSSIFNPWLPAAFHRRIQVAFSKKQTSPKPVFVRQDFREAVKKEEK